MEVPFDGLVIAKVHDKLNEKPKCEEKKDHICLLIPSEEPNEKKQNAEDEPVYKDTVTKRFDDDEEPKTLDGFRILWRTFAIIVASILGIFLVLTIFHFIAVMLF